MEGWTEGGCEGGGGYVHTQKGGAESGEMKYEGKWRRIHSQPNDKKANASVKGTKRIHLN